MGAVGEFLDPSQATPLTLGAFNATAIVNGRPGIFVQGAGTDQHLVSGNIETVAAAAATPLDPTKKFHYLTVGTGTIGTFTGGVEGQVAHIIAAGAITFTNSTADTVNSIHNQGISGAAPADTVCTGATTTRPFYKKYLCTAKFPNLAALQWFEIG